MNDLEPDQTPEWRAAIEAFVAEHPEASPYGILHHMMQHVTRGNANPVVLDRIIAEVLQQGSK